MNVVLLQGNLGRDPDVQFTQSGMAVCNGSLCMTRSFKTGETTREETCWVEFAIWGARGEAFARFHRKGSRALLRGYLKTDDWTDKATGQKRTKLKVVVEDWWFAGNRSDDGPAPSDNAPTQTTQTPDETAF